MVKRLSKGAPFTIAAIAAGFDISRQGVRKHLQVLADADLVRLHPKGRDVQVNLEPHVLERARAFIADLEEQWEVRLGALKRFVEESKSPTENGLTP
jgi:DNA-binding transcriptional ArsR family regulator